MLKVIFRLVSLILPLILSGGSIFAGVPGTLDTSFGTGGIASVPAGGFEAMAIQPDGKIILAGSGNSEFELVRFNANGTLDSGFGTGGIVKTQIFASQTFGSALNDIALQPDGKIIAVGNAHRYIFIPQKPGQQHFFEFVVVRYNANGTLDSSFNSTGIKTTLIDGNPAGNGQSVVLQPDGKIIVGANNVLFRYNTDSTLDNTFGSGGIAQTSFGSAGAGARDMQVQPDGRIVVAAFSGGGFQERSFFVLGRFLPNGNVDLSFDNDGIAVTTIDGNDFAYSLALQPDGKIIAVGAATPGYNSSFANFGLVRYKTSGVPDPTFDIDGRVSINFGFPAAANDGVLQPDGKIVAAGYAINSTTDFALARYLPNGSLDTGFGSGGFTVTNIQGNDRGFAVGLQPGGKIIVGGTSGSNFVAARYFATGNTFADFDGDGKSDISIFRPSNGQWWLNRSSAGVYATTFGNSTDRIAPGDYTGDGKTDIAFWRPTTGEWFVLRSEDGSFFSHPFGASGDIPATGDFDGDGKADEAVFRPSTATWFILRSSGGTTIQSFGASGDAPVVGDYDGDGKSDIAIYRPSVGEWWINRSSNGTTFALQFGTTADRAVPGDYTGDGKSDVAFWRPSTGFWFVLRSEDSSFFSFPFGTTGDIPASGDFDGDGQFDAAVFRPSGATWYVRGSTAGTIIQNFGVTGDIPVESAFVP